MKYLYEELISIGVDVDTAEDAIRFNSDLLEKYGFVGEGYAKKVIDREKVFPTGLISTGRGIAIPHTNPELINKPAVCVLIPKHPLDFCMMGTEDKWIKADVLFPLAVKNPDDQMGMLMKLMRLMREPELLDSVYNAKTKQEIIDILSFIED